MSDFGPPPSSDEEEERTPLGVDSDYRARRTTTKDAPKGFGGKSRFTPQQYKKQEQVAPRYYSPNLDAPAAWSSEKIASLQQDLVKAGLLKARSFRLGVYDDSTRDAYRGILEHANRAGNDAAESMKSFMASPAPAGADRAPFSPRTINPENFKEVADTVGQQLLRRKLTPEEHAQVFAGYNAQYVAAQQSEYNNAETGGATMEPLDQQAYANKRAKDLFSAEIENEGTAARAQSFYDLLRGSGG